MFDLRRLIAALVVAGLTMFCPNTGFGQGFDGHEGESFEVTLVEVEDLPPPIRILEKQHAPQFDDDAQDAAPAKFRRRQAIILSGLLISVAAYGYFTLQFNNRRTDAEEARLAYDADVRENAQTYVDEGVALDEIPTYQAWEDAYSDASSARELLSIAGFTAFLLGAGAIIDSATAGKRREPTKAVSPIIGVSPSTGEILMGARVGF